MRLFDKNEKMLNSFLRCDIKFVLFSFKNEFGVPRFEFGVPKNRLLKPILSIAFGFRSKFESFKKNSTFAGFRL